MKSTPQTSRPMAARRARPSRGCRGGTTSVRSIAVPPVERLPVLRRKKTSPAGSTVSACSRLALQQALGLVIELEAGEHLLVADAAARVAGSPSRRAAATVCVPSPTTWPGTRLATATSSPFDDEHAVVEAGQEGLDEHAPAVLARLLEGHGDLLVGGQVDRHAAAVVGVERLDHDGVAQAPGGARLVGAVAAARHGQAEVAEDLVRLLLVRGDLDGDVARLAGDRGLDALLVLAVAELDEALSLRRIQGMSRPRRRAPASPWTGPSWRRCA
jgi:hypothetical protein